MNDWQKLDRSSGMITELNKNPAISDREICEKIIDPEHYALWEKHFIDSFEAVGNDDTNIFEVDEAGALLAKHAEERKFYATYNFMGLFEIHTYDSEVDISLTKRFVPILEAIVARRTFQFIEKSFYHKQDFTIIANLLFNMNLVTWGTSVRGAMVDSPREAFTPGLVSGEGCPKVKSLYSVTQMFLAYVHFTRIHGQLDT